MVNYKKNKNSDNTKHTCVDNNHLIAHCCFRVNINREYSKVEVVSHTVDLGCSYHRYDDWLACLPLQYFVVVVRYQRAMNY